MLLDVVEAAGVPIEPLALGLPVSLACLRDPRAWLDWDTFALVLARVESACGDTLSLEEIGARLLTVPSFDVLRRAGQLIMAPKQLYEIAARMFAPTLFPDVRVRHSWLPSGRLVLRTELPGSYRASIPFFRICHGNAAALPRLLDLPASKIEEQTLSGRAGRLVLLPPPSHTLLARVRRSVRTVTALGEIWRGIERDQTELEESLVALRTSRHELQLLLERLPDGVVIQRDGALLWANTALLEILGFTQLADVAGRSLSSFVPAEDRAALTLAIRRASASEISEVRHEYRVERPDGSLRRVQATAAQLVDYHGARARMAVVRDVTEQHRLREQAAISDRLASLGALAANIAHEINNPLSYVRLSLETASREAATVTGQGQHLHDSLVHAREGTDRVLGIVRDLRMLSRVQEDLETAIDLPEVLDAALAIADRAIRAKARLVTRYKPTPLARGMGGKLGQVFLNLLMNAADAIPCGSPDDHLIRVAIHEGADGRAVVEIADTGCGISPEIAARVFDPFFTMKPAGSGTGLGLAMCHRIVTELKGEITFESVPGATTFRVTLPAATCQQRSEPAREQESERPRRRVLVIDDEPELLASIGRSLAHAHDVVTAPGGRAALEILSGDVGFDAVLTDLMMAEITGMDLYEKVKDAHPGLERRFLFMTGGAFTARAQRFVEEMSSRCVEKPFDSRHLLDAVDSVAQSTGCTPE